MVKVSVLYPNDEGKTFDMTYYCDKHVPMVRQLLGSSCTNAAVEQGIAGGTPGSKATYIAMGHLYFNTVDDFISSFTPNANEIMGDIPNFTDTTPVVQISEVKF
jgi:uncharacterized protein (TIGR02118 family)